MKFTHRLKFNANPDWKQEYINYPCEWSVHKQHCRIEWSLAIAVLSTHSQ